MKKLWRSIREKVGTNSIWMIIGGLIGAGIGIFFTKEYIPDTSQPVHTWRELAANLKLIGLPIPMVFSITLWMILYIYWEVAAKRAAATTETESRPSRLVHILLLNVAQLILFIPVPGLRARFIPNQISLIILGLSLQLGFLFWAIWARRSLGQNWSGAIATTVDQQLLRSGPYRFVRHPIYTGILGMYLSTALVSGEVHALVGLTLAVIAYWRKIRLEEQHLHALFGAAYKEYCSTTWALIPGII